MVRAKAQNEVGVMQVTKLGVDETAKGNQGLDEYTREFIAEWQFYEDRARVRGDKELQFNLYGEGRSMALQGDLSGPNAQAMVFWAVYDAASKRCNVEIINGTKDGVRAFQVTLKDKDEPLVAAERFIQAANLPSIALMHAYRLYLRKMVPRIDPRVKPYTISGEN